MLKQALILLLFSVSLPALADEAADKNNSVGVDLSASKHYLAGNAELDLGLNRRFLNSLDITLSEQRSGDATSNTVVAAWQGAVQLGFAAKKILSGDLGISAGGDNEKRGSLGVKGDLNADFDLCSWLSLGLSLGTAYTRISAPPDTEVTDSSGQSSKLKNNTAVTQIYPNSGLSLTFFEDAVILGVTAGTYRYQNYTSGLAGTTQRDDSLPADASDTLISGFYDKDWAVSLDIKIYKSLRAGAAYTQTLPYQSSLWIKNVEVDLKENLGSRLKASLGLGRDVANGSGSDTLKAGLNWLF